MGIARGSKLRDLIDHAMEALPPTGADRARDLLAEAKALLDEEPTVTGGGRE